ncbi:c-type cytochrome [Alteromonas facilis]|uniref:c-type cytochrome n=1 Tax=Alteromonas facilis TaxID=2048004 RepID=UPI000C2879FC|nr:cytochrome c [Alteromonas facilis]
MKKVSTFAVALCLGASSALVSTASFADMAQSERQAASAATFRQALLQLVRSNMGPLGGMAKGQIPFDTEVMKTNALRIEQLGTMLPDYFATNTTSFNVDTEALPKIWDNMDDFVAKANDMVVAAQALQVAAESGDEGAYRKAIGGVGATCKGCHDSYKAD